MQSSLGMLSVGDSITDDILHLQNSSGLFVGQATDSLDTITGQTPDTSSSYKWFDHSDWNFVLYTVAPCFPLSFVAIVCWLLYKSCRFLLLPPTTVGITKLCNCLLHFAHNWLFAFQCSTAVARDKYLFFSPRD